MTDFNEAELKEVFQSLVHSGQFPSWTLFELENSYKRGGLSLLGARSGNGKLISVIGFTRIKAIDNPSIDSIEIHFLTTKKEFQRQGRMLSLIEKLLHLNPSTEVFLEVSSRNHKAICLYKKIGFKEVGLRKGYYPDGSDAKVLRVESS